MAEKTMAAESLNNPPDEQSSSALPSREGEEYWRGKERLLVRIP